MEGYRPDPNIDIHNFFRTKPWRQWSLLHFLRAVQKEEGLRTKEKKNLHRQYKNDLTNILQSNPPKEVRKKIKIVLESDFEGNASSVRDFWKTIKNKEDLVQFQEDCDHKLSLIDANHGFENNVVEKRKKRVEKELMEVKKSRTKDDSETLANKLGDDEWESDKSSDSSVIVQHELISNVFRVDDRLEKHNHDGEDNVCLLMQRESATEFKKAFVNIKEKNKWHLRSGRYVENIMYEEGVKLQEEGLVHSWILDMSCPSVKTWFSEQEWQEICSTNPKEEPEIDKLTKNLILRYDVKTSHELRAAVMNPWLQEEYERQKHFDAESLHLAVTDILRLWESGSLLNQVSNLERWYDINVWGPLVDRFFLDLENVALVRGEGCSLASAARKNDQRTLETRRRLGSRGDGIFRSLTTSEEYGSIECGKEAAPTATKTLKDRRKIGKLMKDMIKDRIRVDDALKTFAREIEAIGIVHGKLTADFYTLDLPAGSIARLTCHDECFVPIQSMNMNANDAINVGEMLALIVNVLKHKRRLERSMAIKNKAMPIVPSNHLQRVLSGKKRLSRDSEITESIVLPPTLSTPSKKRKVQVKG